ncbi:MAG: NSS family neurotransmitter:Na+ symporter [Kiritimatiellia bacterium]|jgi:NSS family neurotransmitter:Na+ symporter
MTYGSYLKADFSIPGTAVAIILADTLVAIVAGLIIFPLVFEYGLESTQGVGLIFETLPVAFGEMKFGYIIATAFFVLLLCAATTSFMAVLEVVAHSIKNVFSVSQKTATYFASGSAWLVGVSSVLSFNVWSDASHLSWFNYFDDKNIFNTFDYLLTNVLLLLGGVFIAVFAGWCIKTPNLKEEFGVKNAYIFWVWRFFLCIVAPVVLVLVLIANNII